MTTDMENSAFNLLCALLNRGRNSYYIEICLYRLATSNAAKCCVALRIFFEKRTENIVDKMTAAQTDPTWPTGYVLGNKFEAELDRHFLHVAVTEAAKNAPQSFVEQLLPWFINLLSQLTENEEGEVDYFPSDNFFSYNLRSYYSSETKYREIQITLVNSLIDALKFVAKHESDRFRLYAQQLASLSSETAQVVLARAYVSNPAEYAEDIYRFLLQDRRRFFLGDNIYDSCLLFRSTFVHISTEKRKQLENIVMELRSTREVQARFWRYRQVFFLKSVPAELLSLGAYKRLQELERRYPGIEPKPQAMTVTFGSVTSPITSPELDKMSDDDLINAMYVYDDTTGWGVSREDFFKGGIAQLAQAIHEKVKLQPLRYFELTKRFDERIPTRYISTIMNALAEESDVPAEWIFNIATRFSSRFSGYSRIGFCRSIEKRAKEDIPEHLITTITDWAINDPNPSRDDHSTVTNQSPAQLNEWLNHGINSVRGVALETVLTASFENDRPNYGRGVDLLKQAATDVSPAVGACALQGVLPLLRNETYQLEALNIADAILARHSQLLNDQFTFSFIGWATYFHFDRFGRYIEIMLSSQYDYVRQEGARIACQAALEQSAAQPLQERVMVGDEILRRGAASAYAQYLGIPLRQQISEHYLRQLMFDPDLGVRENVAHCFTNTKPTQIDALRSFVLDYIHSPSFDSHTYYLIKFIKLISISEHTLALQVVEEFISRIKDGITDYWREDIVSIPLAVYNRSNDQGMKARAITIFEQLLLLRVGEAQKALTLWDEYRDQGKMLEALDRDY